MSSTEIKLLTATFHPTVHVKGICSLAPKDTWLVKAAPIIFVFLWATGYPAAKFGTSAADPFTFLAVRFAIASVVLLIFVALYLKPKNIAWPQVYHSMAIGILMQGLYLGGVFFAVSRGMPAGIAALVVALQPFMTATAAIFVLGEKLSLARAIYFAIALVGMFIVLFPDFDISRAIPGVTALTLAAAIFAPLAISIGAVYQKKYVTSLNLVVGTTAQFFGAAIAMGILSFAFETQTLVWTTATVLSMIWLVIVLSIGAVGLLMYLIRRGNSASVASLFYLVPVVSMFMTWILFGETINATQVFGSLIVVACVALSSRYG